MHSTVHKAPPAEPAAGSRQGRSGASSAATTNGGASGDASKVKVKTEAPAAGKSGRSKPSTSKSSGPGEIKILIVNNYLEE